MATRNVIISVGFGPDRQATSGAMKIRRRIPGPSGDTFVYAIDGPDDVLLSSTPVSVPLEVGQYYTFTPVRPAASRITAQVTAGDGPLLFKDLVPVNESSLEPSASPGPAWFSALTDVQDALDERPTLDEVTAKIAAADIDGGAP